MKATGIDKRVDNLGRIVIPKDTHRTFHISECAPLLKTLTVCDRYLWATKMINNRLHRL